MEKNFPRFVELRKEALSIKGVPFLAVAKLQRQFRTEMPQLMIHAGHKKDDAFDEGQRPTVVGHSNWAGTSVREGQDINFSINDGGIVAGDEADIKYGSHVDHSISNGQPKSKPRNEYRPGSSQPIGETVDALPGFAWSHCHSATSTDA
ncbi:MAG: hypothetical protein WCC06_10275 [Candidatus Aminicenantales bacterium]